MPFLNVAILIYGIAMIVLGLLGAAKGSIASLIAAGSIGAIMIGTVALHASNPRAARITAAVVSLIAIIAEVMNWHKKEWAIWPHGFGTVISIVIFVMLGVGHMAATKAVKHS